MGTANDLISGYTAYTDAADFGASAAGEALAFTPILAPIVTSSYACAVSVESAIGATIFAGC